MLVYSSASICAAGSRQAEDMGQTWLPCKRALSGPQVQQLQRAEELPEHAHRPGSALTLLNLLTMLAHPSLAS